MSDTDEKSKFLKIKGIGRDLKIDATCGSCIFFKRFGFYKASDEQGREHVPCGELEVSEKSKPCPNYSVDPKNMRFKEKEKSAELLAKLMGRTPKNKLSLLAAFINQEQRTRKRGFTFGQTVYVKLFPADYLSNYAKAQIIRATREYVYVQGNKGFDATLYHESVLTEEAFAKKRTELQKKKRLIDPNLHKHTALTVKKEDAAKEAYVPKTIDDFVAREVKRREKIKDPDEYFDDKAQLLGRKAPKKAKIFKVQ